MGRKHTNLSCKTDIVYDEVECRTCLDLRDYTRAYKEMSLLAVDCYITSYYGSWFWREGLGEVIYSIQCLLVFLQLGCFGEKNFRSTTETLISVLWEPQNWMFRELITWDQSLEVSLSVLLSRGWNLKLLDLRNHIFQFYQKIVL